ncbi:uncharacterized protein LOC110238041 isoform X2 [Exaiptasia diaphana]|uniref:CAP-Gly domain-containing protein n=1 Tax=Exaiptasia diaphana TaxID=2652724 RepID=A0A913X5V3_EXADI|nr:uncharacterized protein LOC110238041 isoform X2 [Exaiptasia diaphana]
MNSDTSSGEHSGNSNSTTDKSKASKRSRTTRTQNWTSKSMTDHDAGVAGSREAVYNDMMDRESATKAVAIVVHTASKRGYVHLCTEFASLIRENKRMELEINRLKFVISQLQMRTSNKGTSGGECSSDKLQCSSSSSASESGSGGSKGLKSKKTHTKIITTTSPNTQVQRSQDQESSTSNRLVHPPLGEENCKTSEHKSGKENQTTGNSSFELRKAKERILRLESQVHNLTAENQALKAQVQNAEIQNDFLKTIASENCKRTKDRTSPEQILTQSSHAKEAVNPSIGNLKDDENCCLKSCVKHGRRYNPRTLTPSRISSRISTDPCVKPLSIDNNPTSVGNSLTPLQLYKGNQTQDKSPHKSTPLPKIGDYVTIQGEIKGYVNYVGPVHGKGETSDFVGIQLPSPVGNNDGSIGGVKYFTCPQNYGAFVPLRDIKQVDQRPATPFPF